MNSLVVKFAKKLGIDTDELLISEAEAYELIAKHGKASECLKELSNRYNVDLKVLITAYVLGFCKAITMSDSEIDVARHVMSMACIIVESLGKKAWRDVVIKYIKEDNVDDSVLSSYC